MLRISIGMRRLRGEKRHYFWCVVIKSIGGIFMDNIKKSELAQSAVQKGKASFASLRKTLVAAAVAVSTLGVASDVVAQSSSSYTRIEGVAVTGFNRLLSAPVWDLGPGFGGIGFNFVFGYNPDGTTNEIPLTPDSSMDLIVASGFDPAQLAVAPQPDESTTNIPFKDVPVIVAGDGARAPVRSSQVADPWEASKSFPSTDTTLEEWLKARGTLHIKCRSDGTAYLKVNAWGLVPNGVYTLWGVFSRDFSGDGNIDGMGPSALGGVPNVAVASIIGRASIARELNFCPTEEDNLKTIAMAFHSDGNAYGGVPELGGAGFPGGTITHDHLNWAVNVEANLEGFELARGIRASQDRAVK